MRISLNWLQDFVDLKEKDYEKIKDIITARSAEIETMEKTGEYLENVAVGKITKLWPHPNADKLQLTMISNGEKEVQVVCGGSNLRLGMLVAFAQLGAVVKWHGNEVVKMEKAKIRGEESHGMICAAEEIDLEEMFPKRSDKEIVDLSHLEAKVGTPLAKALGLDDTVIDVDNHAITNRADLFSHLGFAREFVANNLAVWKNTSTIGPTIGPTTGKPPVEIKIADKDLCSNYLGVYITGVEVTESPDWMKQRLSACGIRPISNIVDITNYVMLELGMPLHAFDLDQIKGRRWTMRKSKKGEKVVTLDEKEIELFEGITVLDDGNELFDLCGVMGGLNSGIKDDTSAIWLHAPVYNPALTRLAVRGLNQTSDAATIYEKGVDDELAKKGLARAIELIQKLCPTAKLESEIVEIRNQKPEKRVIKLRPERLKQLIGVEIPAKEVKQILEDLGFELKGDEVTVPSWRLNDVKMEADVIEEVARVYSYDKIPFQTPVTEITPVSVNPERRYERELKNKLVAFGYNEIYTFAFLGEELLKKSGTEKKDDMIELANPLSGDLSIMRQSLLPRTLETIAANLRYQKEFSLFELSRVYQKKGDHCVENSELIIASAGSDFRQLQGVVESLGLLAKAARDPQPHRHPGRAATLLLRGKEVGNLYELHPQIARNFDLKETVNIAEIDVTAIHAMNIDHKVVFSELPKYPSVQLDVSILIKKKDLAEDYAKAIEKADKSLIKNIELIDEYTGQNIKESERALTYSITYRSDSETLKDEQVSEVHNKVISSLKGKGAVIRD